MWKNGANAGNRRTSRAVGLPTPTASFQIATIVAGRSSRMSRGLGPVTITDDGARSVMDAVGVGCREKFGRDRGFHGARVEQSLAPV